MHKTFTSAPSALAVHLLLLLLPLLETAVLIVQLGPALAAFVLGVVRVGLLLQQLLLLKCTHLLVDLHLLQLLTQ